MGHLPEQQRQAKEANCGVIARVSHDRRPECEPADFALLLLGESDIS
jgi:hypothetical protein